MIDTNKYEGHTRGPWSIKTGNAGHSVKDANGDHVCTIPDPMGMCNKHIIADAPLLLAEVKDLKRQLSCMIKSYDSIIDAVREFIETDYCSHDGAEWLRYNIGIVASEYVTGEEEESE